MSSQREKELKRLIYMRNELIKEAKKDLKKYRSELQQIEANKSKQKTIKRRK